MVDPALAGQSNADAIRPPQQPYSGAIPPDSVAGSKTDGTLTASGSSSSGGSKATPAAVRRLPAMQGQATIR